ncbi:MAG: NADH-quinone oxidoreductase subunit NuoK [Bacteroidia bacterium]|nr:NADH-quinone oxidoreductase subunit NuoK [Bacteroidia bacterium]
MGNNFIQMLNAIPINNYLVLCSILFSIGVLGVLIRRNIIAMLMSVELMLNAVNLLLAAFSAYRNDATGQVFVMFIMIVAAAEVAVGLGIMVMIYRNTFSIDIDSLKRLKG